MNYHRTLTKKSTRYLVTIAGLLILYFTLTTSAEAAVEGKPCAPEPTEMVINYGDLVHCSLFPGDEDVFRFSGTVGETIEIRVDPLMLQGTDFPNSPTYTLYEPDGTSLNCGPCTLHQTGTYILRVEDPFDTPMMQYALVLERVAPPSEAAQLIEFGQTMYDEINDKGDMDLFYFGGKVGDTISVELVALTGGLISYNMYEPNGEFVHCGFECSLRQTGIHTILISDNFNQQKQYALTLQCVGACPPVSVPDVSGCVQLRGIPLVNRRVDLLQTDEPTRTNRTKGDGCYKFKEAVPGKNFRLDVRGPVMPTIPPVEAAVEGIACAPEPTDMIINYGDLVNCAIDFPGDEDAYRFYGTPGETIVITDTRVSGDVGLQVKIFGPDGIPMPGGCINGTQRNGDCLLIQAGIHTVIVWNDRDLTTQYSLTVERVAPPANSGQPIQYDETIEDEINTFGDTDTFFFQGKMGDSVNVKITKLTDKYSSILYDMYEPDGTRVNCAYGGNCPLNQTGIHTIFLWEYFSYYTIPYSLTIRCDSSVCSPMSIPDVSGCVKFQDVPLVDRQVELHQTGEPIQSKRTNGKGCYKFKKAVPGENFRVLIRGPVVP